MSENSVERHLKNERPDPEELLRRYHLRDADMQATSQQQEQQATPGEDSQMVPQKQPGERGQLRVYLGAAAGVGKTYAMLNEGLRRKHRGTDVVVGYVETHGRPQTELQLQDLEVLPRQKVSYRGVALEEMDTAAILARHPEMVLVDELAHTNVPGSQHVKRYQAVEEILDAGINVITTLNVQHLESLNDMVASITGVRVRETLPDRILDQADEIELVDISPAALRQRMRHGNIYPPERVGPALNNFFREGNLTALREIALRKTADKTDSQLQRYMNEHHIDQLWPVNERVLVGFDARPHSRRILRDAWRLAHGLHADFIAVSIQPKGYLAFTSKLTTLLKFGQKTSEHYKQATKLLQEHILLAEDLGAEVLQRSSHDIAYTMVEIARERQVTQIVVGQPARSPWEELLRGSMVNRLLRLSSDADIHLIPHNKQEGHHP